MRSALRREKERERGSREAAIETSSSRYNNNNNNNNHAGTTSYVTLLCTCVRVVISWNRRIKKEGKGNREGEKNGGRKKEKRKRGKTEGKEKEGTEGAKEERKRERKGEESAAFLFIRRKLTVWPRARPATSDKILINPESLLV